MPLRAVFSDIDGTLVHYTAKLERLGYTYEGTRHATAADAPSSLDVLGAGPRSPDAAPTEVHLWRHEASRQMCECLAVPSATLGGGYVSLATLRGVEELRRRGVVFCNLTGARTSTFEARRDSGTVPYADYDVCEGGGRLWRRRALDEPWIDQFRAATGDWRSEMPKAPLDRAGPLWDVFRLLHADGFKLDAASFGTAFMVDLRDGSRTAPGDAQAAPTQMTPLTTGSAEVTALERDVRRRFAEEYEARFGVALVVNLGKGHVAPRGCDKLAAVRHIAELEGVALGPDAGTEASYAAALFDDENDLGFAAQCRVGFAPSVAHPSVLDALAAAGDRYRRPPVDGLLGIDWAVRELCALCP